MKLCSQKKRSKVYPGPSASVLAAARRFLVKESQQSMSRVTRERSPRQGRPEQPRHRAAQSSASRPRHVRGHLGRGACAPTASCVLTSELSCLAQTESFASHLTAAHLASSTLVLGLLQAQHGCPAVDDPLSARLRTGFWKGRHGRLAQMLAAQEKLHEGTVPVLPRNLETCQSGLSSQPRSMRGA